MRWLTTILIAIGIVVVAGFIIFATLDWSAEQPGLLETDVMTRVKYWRVGDKRVMNPSPDSADVIKEGADHFQHHCQICHGLDGQGTGVPIVSRTSPPVADLASARVQKYTDGQLKWIIENGIRFSGMPGWKGILSEDESWAMVRYIRHLPPKGALGIPKVFQEAEEEHQQGAEMPESHSHNGGTQRQQPQH